MNWSSYSSIEELMVRKLGSRYQRYSFVKHKNNILMKLLKETLISEVHTLLKQNGMEHPPFDPFKISHIGNVQIEVTYLPKEEIGAEGSIEACNNGFIIKIDKNLLGHPNYIYRLRMTMAHELMHTFLYDTRKISPEKFGSRDSRRKESYIEEELCTYLAGEFLVPTFSLNDLLHEKKHLLEPSIENMEFLKSTFIVSSDVIAYRMIKCMSLWNAIFIKFTQDGKIYKSTTRLKYKPNPVFNKLKIPKYVPLETTDNWLNILSHHCMLLLDTKEVKDRVSFEGVELAIESKIETKNPLSFITLISENSSENKC